MEAFNTKDIKLSSQDKKRFEKQLPICKTAINNTKIILKK